MDLEHRTRSFLIIQPRGGNYDALVQLFREIDLLGKPVRLAGARSAQQSAALVESGRHMHSGMRIYPERHLLACLSGIVQRGRPPLLGS